MTLDAGSVSLQPRGILASGSFAQIISTAKMGDGVVSGWTTCDTSTDFCVTFRVFTLCKIGRYLPWMCLVIFVYGRDLGKTAILCARLVCQFRRSRVSRARCTAILVGAMMILSVYLPRDARGSEGHHGRGEEAGSG